MKHRWANYNDGELKTIKRALEYFFWGMPGGPDDTATPDEKILITDLVHEITAEQRGLNKGPETKESTW